MEKQHWVHKYFFFLTICILVISLLLPGCGGGAVVEEEEEVVTQEEEEEEKVAQEEEEEQTSVEAYGKIAFVSGYSSINVINADGSGERRLVRGGMPIWSPAGKRISYSDNEGNLSIINVDGTNNIRIAEKAGNPIRYYSWLPDGQRLVYVVEEDIEHVDIDSLWVLERDGSNPLKIAEGIFACPPSLSPDGGQLAVIMGPRTVFDPQTGWSSTEYHLHTINLSGTGKVKLADLPDTAHSWAVSWSPGGNKIAYCAFGGMAAPLIVINSDGTNEIVIDLLETPRLAWAPDGKRIAYVSADDALMTANPDGTAKEKLVQGRHIFSITWSPDAQWLAFQKEEEIFIVNIDGTGLTQLAYGTSPQWSPTP